MHESTREGRKARGAAVVGNRSKSVGGRVCRHHTPPSYRDCWCGHIGGAARRGTLWGG
jgi:hypothetical protein